MEMWEKGGAASRTVILYSKPAVQALMGKRKGLGL